jgi:nucleoside-diphosphate-sugar epimerase
LRRFGADVVLDVIAFTERQARDLVTTFRGAAGRVVVLSSADVYRNYDGLCGKSTAPPDAGPLGEDAPLRETYFPYRGLGFGFAHADDYEKILVEQVVLNGPELPATVLRLPAVYGPGDRSHRPRPYLRRMNDGRDAILLEDEQARWKWTRGYVENVAAAIALAVTDSRAARRIYNVGDATAFTEREWVAQIGGAAGWNGNVVTMPRSALPPDLRQSMDWRYGLWTSTRRIRDELGYDDPVSREAGMLRTLEWERAHLSEVERPDYEAEDAVLRVGQEDTV